MFLLSVGGAAADGASARGARGEQDADAEPERRPRGTAQGHTTAELADLSIAGDGSALGAARKMVESIGCGSAVRFLGYLRGEEKASALANHDLYCLPTYHPEGIPVALLEAMAFGLPIAVADSGGIADIFDETKMGALVRPQEPDALADSLIRLANDRNRMEQIASFNREFARENFLASRVATRIASYYSTLHEGI